MKKYLSILLVLLTSCVVKEIENGGDSRLQWSNSSREVICAWGYDDGSGPQVFSLDSLQPGAKSKTSDIEIWGEVQIFVDPCSGARQQLGFHDFTGASLLWTLENVDGKWSIREKVLSDSWF